MLVLGQEIFKNIPHENEIWITSAAGYSNRIFESYTGYAKKYLIKNQIRNRNRSGVLGICLTGYFHQPLYKNGGILLGFGFARTGELTPVFNYLLNINKSLFKIDSTMTNGIKTGYSFFNEYYLIEFPFLIKHEFIEHRQLKYYLSGGLSPDLLIRDKTTLIIHDLALYKKIRIDGPESGKLRSFYFHSSVVTGLKHHDGKNMDFIIQAEFKYYFKSPLSGHPIISTSQLGDLIAILLCTGFVF